MSVAEIAQLVTAGVAVFAFGAAVWQVRSAKQMAAETIAQTDRQAHSAQIVFSHVRWWIARTRLRDPRRFCEWEAMLEDLEARRTTTVER